MDDSTLLQRFEAGAIPRDQWHHREHIKIAYLYLTLYPLAEAEERVRSGIQKLNAANKVPETPTSGYHETTTQAWLRLVASALAVHGPQETADEFYDAHPELSEKKALLLFYSPDCLMSPEAKRRFLEPDLAPLPLPRVGRKVAERRVLDAGGGLQLRPVEAADAEELAAAVHESLGELSPWMSWCDVNYELRHSLTWTSLQPLLWARGEAFSFVLEEVGQPGIAGTCGLNAIQEENRFSNLGYWVRTSRTRQGLASRAARRVAAFGIEEVGLERIEVVAATGNVASQRTAARAGALREGILRRRITVREKVFDAVMFAITRA